MAPWNGPNYGHEYLFDVFLYRGDTSDDHISTVADSTEQLYFLDERKRVRWASELSAD